MFWAVKPAFSAMSMNVRDGRRGAEAVLPAAPATSVAGRSKLPQRRVRTTKFAREKKKLEVA